MKIGRLGARGEEIPVVWQEGRALDARPVFPDITPEALSPAGLSALRDAVESGALRELAGAASLRVGSPVVTPGAVLCIGMNYAAHAAESGALPPEHPVLFLKTPNTIAGPNDDVVIPPGAERVDWEVELAIVIGTRAYQLDGPEQALAHIAGFTLADDVSEREFQIELSGGQWSKGKCSPGFTPLGPWLVTPDEFDSADASLRSWVNGEPRQDSSTRDMIFSVATIVSHLSRFVALEPGDVVLTGTPEGVALSGRFPYLSPGDIVEVEVEGLGKQRHEFTPFAG